MLTDTLICFIFQATKDDKTIMLQDGFTQKNAFIYSNGTVRDLRLHRNKFETQKAIKIGWRYGLGADTVLPANGGVVDCPVPPCVGMNTDYMLKIDRVSNDLTKVYARYSFEVIFPSEGLYTVYFEGCCRPNDDLVNNNALLTFHVRSGM